MRLPKLGRRGLRKRRHTKTSKSMFGDEYFQKFGFREQGFRAMFAELQRFDKPTIVETGTVRSDDSFGTDGSSTRFFYDYVKTFGGVGFTIDIDPQASALAVGLCPGTEIITITGDSVGVLARLGENVEKIDFLYLDSFDIRWDDPTPSSLHHLAELAAAMKLLRPGSAVFVDDNKDFVGKGTFVKYTLLKMGAEQIFDQYQIGFRLP